jgi:hypothetical protein
MGRSGPNNNTHELLNQLHGQRNNAEEVNLLSFFQKQNEIHDIQGVLAYISPNYYKSLLKQRLHIKLLPNIFYLSRTD